MEASRPGRNTVAKRVLSGVWDAVGGDCAKARSTGEQPDTEFLSQRGCER
jgi:hypothetical protein